MLDCTPYCSAGNRQQEKESTQRLTLSDEQKKLIENNLAEIKTILGSIFNKNNIFSGRPSELVDQAISYLPDVTLEYKQTKSNGITFAKYATYRCTLRLIDEYRKMNRHCRTERYKRSVLKRIQGNLLSINGFVSDDSLQSMIEEAGEDPKDYLNLPKLKKYPIEQAKNVITPINEGIEAVDWVDFKDGMIRLSERFFTDFTENNSLSSKVYKIIIKDYLIPKCEGLETKTLGQIAEQVGLHESRISQMIHGERMKRFIQVACEL